jgi:hypothetical protein
MWVVMKLIFQKLISTANPLMLTGTFTALAIVIDAGMRLETIVSGPRIVFYLCDKINAWLGNNGLLLAFALI